MCPTPNHMATLKVLGVSLSLMEYSNTIDTNPFIHRSSVHRGVKHIGMQKVNHTNTYIRKIGKKLNRLSWLHLENYKVFFFALFYKKIHVFTKKMQKNAIWNK